MAFEFYLGVDLIEAQDTAAVALVEKSADGTDGPVGYHVHRLERLRVENHEEASLAERVSGMINDEPYLGRTILVVNETDGRGQEVREALEETGLSPVGVMLSGGDAETGTSGPIEISEHEVVTVLQQLYRDGRFRMDGEKTDDPSRLARGLQSYRARSVEAGDALQDITPEARRNADDTSLVLSAGIACWLGEQHTFDPSEHLAGDVPTTGPVKRRQRADTSDYFEAVQENPELLDHSTRKIEED